MKEFLKKKLARLEKKRAKLDERCKASQDAAEIRSLTDDLADINDEIEEIRAEISALESAEQRQTPPDNAEQHNAGIVGSFTQPAAQSSQRSDENILESKEYRTAFMRYFQRGIEIPAELRTKVADYMAQLPAEARANDAISTANNGAVIPLTIMREVINTIRVRYGNLYNKVRKTAVPGGVEYPIGDLQADFDWVTESTVSVEKGIGDTATVSFKYHTLELRIAQTFLSALLSIEAFESRITEVIAIAYLKAMDTAIVKGSGVGQPLGILNDTRVTGAAGHTISMTEAQISDWTQWRKRFFSNLPLGYRYGEFIFSSATVDAYLETMADGNNNPIFRQATGLEVNDGDSRDPNGRFFGRSVSLVEPNILPDFATASSNDVIGIFWQPDEYAVNENFGFMMRRYFDERSNKWINKALAVVDGKVLNPAGIYLITKA